MKRILGWVVLALALGAAGCDRGPAVQAPLRLIGTWRTDDPRYSGRYLKIAQNRIVFGGELGLAESHLITGVGIEPAKGGTAYTLSYLSAGGDPYEFRLIYRTDKEGLAVLTFANQPGMRWLREGV
ncbi:MAG: hypothetical protein KBD01_01635 [Acidobacteria bacterium]|nr:hypothetical protein [Acidobacteriota bacterium]